MRLTSTLGLAVITALATSQSWAQTVRTSATPVPEPAIKLSTLLSANIDIDQLVTQEASARAYAKLLEGERYLWKAKNMRGARNAAVQQQNIRNARLAFQDAIAANPRLAEAYTALAELAITIPPPDLDEAIALSNLALKINKNNFGARRILARLYTYKSGLGSRSMDSIHASKAIDEWKLVASLDPRYAEAWAFLAEFYDRQGRDAERIEALEKWRSSSVAVDSQFFRQITGGRSNLSTEEATLKLGEALLKAGRTGEAIAFFSQVVVDSPQNADAVESLSNTIRNSSSKDIEKAVLGLQQAVYANPENPALVNLLADAYVKIGRLQDAARALNTAVEKTVAIDRALAAMYATKLGELFERADRVSDAWTAYEKAISLRGLDDAATLSDDERIFLREIFERMIRSGKAAERSDDVLKLIERARRTLGAEDSFADRHLTAFYRDGGRRPEALKVIREQRRRNPHEEGLARLEATLLVEMGRVDEAVDGYRRFMQERSAASTRPDSASVRSLPPLDVFSSLLFISQLYSQADRGKEAVDAGNQALAAARGAERRQIARLTIATAHQRSGSLEAAEMELREILKESPNNPIALNNLGYFLLERGERYDEALTMIRKAVETDPTNPSYLDSLGWAYFKIGKLGEAEMYLREAVRQDPSSSTINEHLGDVYAAQRKSAEAEIHWRRALILAADQKDIGRLKQKLGNR